MSQHKKVILIFTLLVLLVFSASLIFFNFQKNKSHQKNQQVLREDLLKKVAELKNQEKAQEKPAESGFCGNEYLPLIPGANWRFDLKEDGTIKDIIEVFAVESEKGKQVLNYHFKERDWTNKTTYLCLASGIKVDSLNFFLGTERSYVFTTPLSARGIIFPADFNENYLWQFKLRTQNEVVEKSDYQRIDRRFNENLSLELELKDTEPIETPAGILETRKIDLTFFIEEKNPLTEEWLPEENAASIAEETEGSPEDDALFSFKRRQLKCSVWLAKQIGIVKSVCQEKNREPVVLTLRSFQIPAVKN